MSRFDYASALNKVAGKHRVQFVLNHQESIPSWARTCDFTSDFLPFLTIVGDSREQNDWIERACKYYGIRFEKAVKNAKEHTENLKEGDYTFRVEVGDRVFDYRGVVAYERKATLSELCNNCKSEDRERIEREFKRFIDKGYKKVVLVIEFGENIYDLAQTEYTYKTRNGVVKKYIGNIIFSALMSWRQPNNFNFNIIQSFDHTKLFWLMLMDMFYYFRNDIKKEWEELC